MHSGAGREKEGEVQDFTFISANAFYALLCSSSNVPALCLFSGDGKAPKTKLHDGGGVTGINAHERTRNAVASDLASQLNSKCLCRDG